MMTSSKFLQFCNVCSLIGEKVHHLLLKTLEARFKEDLQVIKGSVDRWAPMLKEDLVLTWNLVALETKVDPAEGDSAAQTTQINSPKAVFNQVDHEQPYLIDPVINPTMYLPRDRLLRHKGLALLCR